LLKSSSSWTCSTASLRRVGLRRCATQRLPAWAGGLTQDRLVQFRLGQQSLQPRVLLLQFLEPLGLVDHKAAVLFAPTVVRLLRDAEQLAHRRHALALRQFHVRLPKLIDHLLGRMPRSIHDLSPDEPHPQNYHIAGGPV
jgi:hypothetical protein